MKVIFAIIIVSALSTVSLLTYAQSFYQNNTLPVADKISQLRSSLEEIYHNRPEQPLNSYDALRLERAIHYLQLSRDLEKHNWHKRAILEAEKGIELVALYNQNKAES